MKAVFYTDLNCPFCYATETRLEALGVQHEVEWRGVEHEPDLPVPIQRDDPDLNEEVADEVQQVRSRAPEVPIEVPTGKPNTARGIAAAVAATRADAASARAFRHALYRAFWVDGADVSSPDVIQSLANDHGVAAAVDPRPEDTVRVTEWRLDWERSPLRGVPLLVRSDGEILYGLKDVEVLARFMDGA
jgi:predicted DsbA family dithiol-disulfide isomerase